MSLIGSLHARSSLQSGFGLKIEKNTYYPTAIEVQKAWFGTHEVLMYTGNYDQMTWPDAKARCEKAGLQLVSLCKDQTIATVSCIV